MTTQLQKIAYTIKKLWHFTVGFSTIISCIAAIISCYIACIAVSEIISLNIEISPIAEKIQKESIVIEKTIPAPEQDKTGNNEPVEPKEKLPDNDNLDLNSEDSSYLSETEIDNIRKHRDSFLKQMNKYLNN